MDIKEILAIILNYTDDISIYYYSQTSKSNNKTVLEFTHTKIINNEGRLTCKNLCTLAAYHAYLEALKWARNNGFPWDENTCQSAADKGHLEILEWARKNNCPWDENTCAYAASGGHLEVLTP